jgi:hypothetical protein
MILLPPGISRKIRKVRQANPKSLGDGMRFIDGIINV